MQENQEAVVDAPTRLRVTESILAHGPSTATALAERLEVTPAAIRRHLDNLVADGWLFSAEQRVYGQRRRGRPARVFGLTDTGRNEFMHAYDDLAGQALEFLAATGGDDAVKAFARHRLADIEARYSAALEGSDDRAATLAELLTEDGFAASVNDAPTGLQICQHHCPVANVAEQFPQLCDAETELFAELLGTHVQRLATIAHGDGVCTTHLPRTEKVSS